MWGCPVGSTDRDSPMFHRRDVQGVRLMLEPCPAQDARPIPAECRCVVRAHRPGHLALLFLYRLQRPERHPVEQRQPANSLAHVNEVPLRSDARHVMVRTSPSLVGVRAMDSVGHVS